MPATDTDAATARILHEIRARIPRNERLRHACEASDLVRAFALARLRARHPDWPEAELLRALLRRQFPPGKIPEVLR